MFLEDAFISSINFITQVVSPGVKPTHITGFNMFFTVFILVLSTIVATIAVLRACDTDDALDSTVAALSSVSTLFMGIYMIWFMVF